MNVHRIVTHLFALSRLEISLSTFCTFSTFLCLTVRFPCLFLFFFIQNRSSCFINSVKVSKNLKIKSRSMYNLFSVFSAFNGVVVVMSQISSQCPQAKKTKCQSWCGNTMGDVCSGLYASTNQGRLGFREGDLKETISKIKHSDRGNRDSAEINSMRK